MPKKTNAIPVNRFAEEDDPGFFIERISFKELPNLEEWNQPERHDRHSFFLMEKGSVSIEIDFQKYHIKSPSVIYMHPDQVHRIMAFEKQVTVSAWAMNNESLNPEYLKLLEGLTPTKPLALNKEMYSMISDAVNLCLKFSKQKKNKLSHLFLKDSCNSLIGLVVSQYLERSGSTDKSSRFDAVAKSFKELLELQFTTTKSPTAYAEKLNLSTPYLNECVKKATGYSVSHHIQQRVILEAKRLLYHSDKSVKEIAAELGYDDYPYFSRLFTKTTGMPALAFRNKNLD